MRLLARRTVLWPLRKAMGLRSAAPSSGAYKRSFDAPTAEGVTSDARGESGASGGAGARKVTEKESAFANTKLEIDIKTRRTSVRSVSRSQGRRTTSKSIAAT